MDSVVAFVNNGLGVVPLTAPNFYVSLETAAAGDTEILAAIANRRFRLLAYRITSNGLLGALGSVDVRLRDSSGDLPFSQQLVLPAALSVTMSAPYAPRVEIVGGYACVLGSNVLVNLSAALAAGVVRVELAYQIEA